MSGCFCMQLMVSLDQAMTEGEIFPARIKEALWGSDFRAPLGFREWDLGFRV